jgi:hypothetical protein
VNKKAFFLAYTVPPKKLNEIFSVTEQATKKLPDDYAPKYLGV